MNNFCFQIFDINKNLIYWTESKNNAATISNVKYVALSTHDRLNGKYLGLIKKFVLPASIMFNMDETLDKIYDKEYAITVPASNSKQIEFDKAVLVFRLDMMKVGAIFVKIRNSPCALLV